MNFTAQQLQDFHAYVRVQRSGRYNMLDPRAKAAAGLDRDRFLFVLTNYDELADAVSARSAT